MTDILVCIFLLVLLTGSIYDLKSFEIPNYVVLVATFLFFPVALSEHMSLPEIFLHILAGGVVLLVGFVLYSFNFIGAGDAKLLAASSIWFGFAELPIFLCIVAMVGGFLSLLLIIFRKVTLPAAWAQVGWIQNLYKEKGVPYGVAISAGAILSYPYLFSSQV